MSTLFNRTLEAYGVDLNNTPETIEIYAVEGGIVVEQFARDENGETVLNWRRDDLVRERRFFPHPAEES